MIKIPTLGYLIYYTANMREGILFIFLWKCDPKEFKNLFPRPDSILLTPESSACHLPTNSQRHVVIDHPFRISCIPHSYCIGYGMMPRLVATSPYIPTEIIYVLLHEKADLSFVCYYFIL